MPQLPIVGMAISWKASTAHCSSKAMSSVLMSGIAFCRVGSAVLVGEVCASGWSVGVVTGAGVDC